MDKHIVKAILLGGLIAGTLDIVLVSLINLYDPLIILRVVASGVLGRPTAMAGGLPVSALGMLLQWLMSLLMAAIYVVATTRLARLPRYWPAAGLAYGAVTFVVMNYVVVPLSLAKPKTPFVAIDHWSDFALMLIYGVVIAFFARRPSAGTPNPR